MTARDVLLNSLGLSEHVLASYLGDLSDADLLVRPVAGMNHVAWQLGHMIGAERHFVDLIAPGTSPALPEDWEAGHGRQGFTVDDPAKFLPRARYQELWASQRAATRALIGRLSDADLDRADPSFPPYAPTVGALLNLCASHPLMHAGQFVAVRRALGKPVSI